MPVSAGAGNTAPSGAKPTTPAGAPAMKAATAAGPAVRTVVDADGASTALAIAALVASLISFGVVLMSFLQK